MEKIYKGEIQRLLPIFQAMADGKTIQTKNGIGWIDIDGDEDGLNLDSIINYQDCYRIKPEVKYRSFKNAEECWNEMLKHKPFGWVIKKCEKKILITEVLTFGINLHRQESPYRFDEANRILTFADGLPFGVKVEE